MGNTATKQSYSTKLTESEIDLLLKNTSFDREQILDWHQGFIENCPNGSMSRQEFISFYSKLYPSGKAQKYCDQVFKVFDEENKGVINFSAFLMVISITTLGDVRKKIELAFYLYDLDKNGSVDKVEMEKIVESMYELLEYDAEKRARLGSAKAKVETMMKKLDKNNDLLLSKDEFIDGCLKDDLIRELLVPYA